MNYISVLLIALPLVFVSSLSDDDGDRLSHKRVDTPPDVIAISEVYENGFGSPALVQGRVSVPSGTFEGATHDPGFAVHDGTRGIFVKTASNLDLRVGDAVRVSGTVGALNGMVSIDSDDVESIHEREIQLPTGHLEVSTSGSIVVVQGEIQRIVNDDPFGTKIFIDDGTGELDVFVSSSADIDLSDLDFIQLGRTIRARGYVAFFPDFSPHPELDLRSTKDVREIKD